MRHLNFIAAILIALLSCEVWAQQNEDSDSGQTRLSTNKSLSTTLDSWNYLIINFWENPALAGINNRHNFVIDISNDHAGDGFKTGYDFLLPLKGSLAISLGAYYTRKGVFSNNMRMVAGIAGAVQYHFQNRSSLSAGLSLGIVNKQNDRFSIYQFFTAYYGSNTFYPNIPENWDSAHTFKTNITRFGPVNVGVWYTVKNYFAGISIDNITRYNESVFSSRQPSPVYFQIATGYHFNIKDKVTVTPSIVYRTQHFLVHRIDPRLTVSFARNRVIIGTHYQNKRLYGMVGVDVVKHIQQTLDIGGSVSKESDHADIFIATTLRVRFMARKNKSYPGK